MTNERRVRVTPTDDNVQSSMLQQYYALLHSLSNFEIPTGTFAFTYRSLRPYAHDNWLQITYLLVIIHPFTILLEVDFSERCFLFDANTFPSSLGYREANYRFLLVEDRVLTLGSKLVNSRPLQSIVIKGENCPRASAR